MIDAETLARELHGVAFAWNHTMPEWDALRDEDRMWFTERARRMLATDEHQEPDGTESPETPDRCRRPEYCDYPMCNLQRPATPHGQERSRPIHALHARAGGRGRAGGAVRIAHSRRSQRITRQQLPESVPRMTCIAVVRGPDGVVWIGADSCISRGSNRTTLAEEDPKAFSLSDDVWFGWTGYAGLGSSLRYGFSLPERIVGESEAAWVTLRLLPAMRTYLIDQGLFSQEVDPDDDGWPRGIRGECVLVVGQRIFHLAASLVASQIASQHFAVGSGEDVALGALHAVMEVAPFSSPETTIRSALAAAATHADGVSIPFIVHRCAPDELP